MSFSAVGFLGTSRFTDLSLDATVKTLASAALVLYGIYVDNSQNSEDVYVKIWDATSVTLGTDAPPIVLKVDAGDTFDMTFWGSDSAGNHVEGHAFTTGLSIVCVTTGGTGGTTSPTNDVKATLITD